MADLHLRSHYSDVMGRFEHCLHDVTSYSSSSDVSLASVNPCDSNNNISNNMFLGYGPSSFSLSRLVSRDSPAKADHQAQDTDAESVNKVTRSHTAAKATSSRDLTSSSREVSPDVVRFDSQMLGDERESSMDLQSPSFKSSNPYTNWRPEVGTERASMDLSNMMNKPGVLQTLRSNLHNMAADMESDRYRESAMRLEVRLSEMLGGNRPWDVLKQAMLEEENKIKKSGSAVDPRFQRLAKALSSSREVPVKRKEVHGSDVDLEVEQRTSLLSNHMSAMSDIQLMSQKLTRPGESGSSNSFVESQINVMNNILEDIKVSGSSVDPSHAGERDGPVAALYDSLNIEKLRLQTIESLLSQANPNPSRASLANIRRELRRKESLSAGRYFETSLYDEISSLSTVPSLVTAPERNISMNRHVSSSVSYHNKPQDTEVYHTTSPAASLPRKKDRKGSSKSSSNLADTHSRSNINRISNIKKKTGSKSKVGQGEHNGLNKSQNWNRESTPKHKPETYRRAQWLPSLSDVLDYPGVNFCPQSMFHQWLDHEHVKQQPSSSRLDQKDEEKKTNAESSQARSPDTTVYCSTCTQFKKDTIESTARSTTAVSNSTQRKQENKKPPNQYQPQIPISENRTELQPETETDECKDSDSSEQSTSEATDNSSTSFVKSVYSRLSGSRRKVKTKVKKGSGKKSSRATKATGSS